MHKTDNTTAVTMETASSSEKIIVLHLRSNQQSLNQEIIIIFSVDSNELVNEVIPKCGSFYHTRSRA
jgi:hypothetical protein